MKQLIYRSHPFGFDRAMLAGILVQARRNNRINDITGGLICRHDLYLQLIEGPPAAIDALFAKIAEDNRHSEVRLALSEEVGERMFPEWEMLDDEMPTLTWSPEEVAAGMIEAATPEVLREVFAQIAAKGRTKASEG